MREPTLAELGAGRDLSDLSSTLRRLRRRVRLAGPDGGAPGKNRSSRRANQERVGVVRDAGPVTAGRPARPVAAELPSSRRSDGAAQLCWCRRRPSEVTSY